MKRPFPARLVIAALIGLLCLPAQAYIGPGLGVGAIAAVLGVIGGVLMLVVGIVWYPLKRLWRRLRSKP